MKKNFLVAALFTLTLAGYSQVAGDSLKEVLDVQSGKLNSIDERLLLNEADLAKLTKIKVSGYIQSQWEYYGTDLVKLNEPDNTFYIRRARVKFTYEAADGIKFVLQPDFSTGNISLKDAYTVVNLPMIKGWSLWAGQFNRPDYEVEYSSSSRETLERSRVIRAIYPGEREVGMKLEYTGTKLPVLFQLAALNGNFTGANAKDFDSRKDIMARLVYSASIPSAGLGIDFGAHGYFGGIKAKTNPYFLNSDATLDSLNTGDYLDKQWFGAELRIFADVLGGLSLRGEYISGKTSVVSAIAATATRTAKLADPNKIKNFSGYYLYLIKNIGKKNQLVAKYDFYDPNTKLAGDAATSDVYYKTLTLGWLCYLNDFIRVSLQYEMPQNEKNATIKNIDAVSGTDLRDNTLAIRIQAKF